MKLFGKFSQYRVDRSDPPEEEHTLDNGFDSYRVDADQIFMPKLTDSKLFSDDWNVIGDSDLERLISDPYHSQSNVVYILDDDINNIFSD